MEEENLKNPQVWEAFNKLQVSETEGKKIVFV